MQSLRGQIENVPKVFIYALLAFFFIVWLYLFSIPTALVYYYFQLFMYRKFSVLPSMHIYPCFLVLVTLTVFTILILFLNKYTIKRFFGIFLVILITIFFIGELVIPLIILRTTRSKIENIISEAKTLLDFNRSVEDLVRKITYFVDSEVKVSYSRPESALEIDIMLTPIDYCLLGICGFDRAHVILFQGWGSCGQYARVTEYLLVRSRFSTRCAKFKDIDHEWVEVYINGTWFIIDPWYIAHYFNNSIMIPAHRLSTAVIFENSGGVIVYYRNGTQIDASAEHGYDAKSQ